MPDKDLEWGCSGNLGPTWDPNWCQALLPRTPMRSALPKRILISPLTRTVFPGGWHFVRGRSLAPHTDRNLQGSALGKRMVIGLPDTEPYLQGGRYLARGH